MGRFLKGSRYTNGVVSENAKGEQFLVLRQLLSLDPDEDDSFLTITSEMINRPDILSFIAYQRPDLWWAILDVNEIKSVFDIRINQKLRIPDLTKLLSAISNLNRGL